MKWRTLIIEDSRLARLELRNLLQAFPQIELIGECEDALVAEQMIRQQQPDLLLLDIQLPGKNGFELLDSLNYLPKVIFTTAYDEYALKSFDYEALDYLLKPIEAERLTQSLKRLQQAGQNSVVVDRLSADSSVFVKDGEQCWMLELSRISHFTSCGNYSHVHFEAQRPLIHKSLTQLEQRLPENLFFRANRQQIVNLKKIASVSLAINGNLELQLKDGTEVEVSRRQASRFKELLSF